MHNYEPIVLTWGRRALGFFLALVEGSGVPGIRYFEDGEGGGGSLSLKLSDLYGRANMTGKNSDS